MEQGEKPEKVVSPFPGWKAFTITGAVFGMGVQAVYPGVLFSNLDQNRLAREALLGKRLARLARLFRVGGVPAGLSLGTAAVVHNYLIEKRQVIDAYNWGVSCTHGYILSGLTAPRAPPKVVVIASVVSGIEVYALTWAFFKTLETVGLNANDFLKPSK